MAGYNWGYMGIFLVLVFLFGLAVGSFLNAVIYRMEKGESAFQGRSYCPHCRHQLSWQDVIPLLSFLMLGGRCRYCRKPISWQYPIVELATGILFVLAAQVAVTSQQLTVSNILYFGYLLVVICLLIIIFVYDLKYYSIPDTIVYSAIFVSSIWYFVSSILLNTQYEIRNTLYSAILIAAIFFVIYFASKGTWLGFGDVKLAFFMGLFLGWPNILVGLFLAFGIGGIIGIVLIALKKKTLKSEVPFGPFLITAIFITLFIGENLVNWYMDFLF